MTAGYDSFSNLQLYRVNGIPILNLRHLCHVLDKFTLPHTSAILQTDPTIDVSNTEKTPGGSAGNTTTTDDRNDLSLPVCSTVETFDREKDETYTSFKTIDGGESALISRERETNDETSLNEKEELSEEDLLYSQYHDGMDNLYFGVGDDPLLLDCTNFIHFELDKDKVAVFNIATAYTQNSEILRQYAITSSRSDNLPEQKY